MQKDDNPTVNSCKMIGMTLLTRPFFKNLFYL